MFDVDGCGRDSRTGFADRNRARASRGRLGRAVVAGARLTVALPLLLSLSSFDATAQEMTLSVTAAGCGGCHGPDGKSTGTIPSLDKIDAATMAAKLKGFRSGELEATVMNRLSKAFTDIEIDALAKFMAAR
jgi:cytochrome subunit of sulfide dehydrogenase